jgi:DNA polymerase/3'-5' exonuclease PolX
MTNREIALVLFNVSTMLKQQQGNPYRIRAYRNAARALLRLPYQVAERVAAGEPLGIPRLGERLTRKISELASTGQASFYDELCDTLPPEERHLVRVPGIGPTIAARIHKDLGNTDAESLRRAAATGKLQQVWGLGPQRLAALLDSVGGQLVQEPLPFEKAA